MAADRPTREPTQIQSGATLFFDRSYPDFSAAEWTLNYYLRAADFAPIDFTASANGTDHRVEVAAATTAVWNPGIYLMIGRVTDIATGLETHQVYRKDVEVLQDFPSGGPADTRSFWQKIKDQIEDILAGKMARQDISYSINGRTFTAKSDEDYLRTYEYACRRVAAEKRGGKMRKILVKFVEPR